jgi:arabinofuranosyltransferase
LLLVSFLFFVITQWILLGAIRRCAKDGAQEPWPYQGLYLVLILSQPAYVTWMTITLMDTVIWGLMIAAMTYVVILPPASTRGWGLATIPFVLAPVSRPEGMVVAPVLLGLLWLRSRSIGSCSATRLCIGTAGAVLVMMAGLTVFRVLYFGYPFPNTFYAKVSPSILYNLQQGKRYLDTYVLSGTVVGACVVLVALSAASWFGAAVDRIRSSRSMNALWMSPMKASAATSMAGVALLLIPVLIGGDSFGLFRFYQPAFPLLCIASILVLMDLRVLDVGSLGGFFAWARHHVTTVAVCGTLLAYWLFTHSSTCSWTSLRWSSPISKEFRIAKEGMVTGKTLGALFAPAHRFPAIGAITCGGIARTYPGPIVDLMGLNNSFIAHFKGDRKGIKNHAAFEKDAFFLIEPEILLASPPLPPDTNNWCSIWLKGLLGDPRFVTQWRYGVLSSGESASGTLQAFVKTASLNDILAHGALEFHDTMVWSNKWVEVTRRPDNGRSL